MSTTSSASPARGVTVIWIALLRGGGGRGRPARRRHAVGGRGRRRCGRCSATALGGGGRGGSGRGQQGRALVEGKLRLGAGAGHLLSDLGLELSPHRSEGCIGKARRLVGFRRALNQVTPAGHEL